MPSTIPPFFLIPIIAAVLAFVTAVLTGVGVAFRGSIVALPLVLISLFASVEIVRRRVWSAYGYALFLLAQSLLVILVVLRAGDPAAEARRRAGTALLSFLLAWLFIVAGRSLQRFGAQPGARTSWIAGEPHQFVAAPPHTLEPAFSEALSA